MINGEQERKISELQYSLRAKGVLKSKDEIFEMMINLVKDKFNGK